MEKELARNGIMEEGLARGVNTPAVDAALDLLVRIGLDPANDERYPSDLVLIAADLPHVSEMLSRAVAQRRALALVFPDGSNLVARPPEGRSFEWLTRFYAAPPRAAA